MVKLDDDRVDLCFLAEGGEIGALMRAILWSKTPMGGRLHGTHGRRAPPWRLGAVHPGDVERVRAAWATAFSQGTPYAEEQRVRGRDGQYRRFVARAFPVKDERGQPVELYGTSTEVEEHRRAEEERTHLLHRLINAQEEEERAHPGNLRAET